MAAESVAETIVLLPLVMPPVSTGVLLRSSWASEAPSDSGFTTRRRESFSTERRPYRNAVIPFAFSGPVGANFFDDVFPRSRRLLPTLGALMRKFSSSSIPLAYKGVISGPLAFFPGRSVTLAQLAIGRDYSAPTRRYHWRSSLGQTGTIRTHHAAGDSVILSFIFVGVGWCCAREK